MFCYCRSLRHALLSRNKPGILRLQFLPSNYVHPESLSTKINEFVPEKKLPFHVIGEINGLEFAWGKNRDGKLFRSIIHKYFTKVEGSTSDTLYFLRAACDKARSHHHEMIYTLLITLNDAILERGLEFNPSIEEKIEALKCVLIYGNYYLIREVCKIFKLNEASHLYKELVDNLLRQEKLVEAAFCIGTLNLQHEYDIESILFPLVLEENLFPVKQCVDNHPNLQLNIAKKLDSMMISEENDSRAIKFSRNTKRIIKILSKWVDWFKIPLEHCPNFHFVRSRQAVNVLIRRRAEQSVSENVWEDMVMAIVGNDASLKEHLIYKLLKQNDKETALKMVEKLNMNDFDVTKLNLTEDEADLENIADKVDLEDLSKEEFEAEKSEHLMFNLSSSDIKYVDNAAKFTNFLNEVLNYDVAGIDTEWKPHFGLSAERLALMQIAVRDKVFILDMVHLRDCLLPEHWDSFMENLFGNKDIVKLGCGIMNDVQMIIEDCQGTKGKKIGFTHILDMSVFYNKLLDIYPDEMQKENVERKNIGLSKLCELILGLPLNKEERLCDWEKRPLAESQLEYAALDALCLVQMYDKLKLNAAERNMNFDHLANVSMYLTASMWKPKKRIKGMKFEKAIQIKKPIPIHQFKVAVDSSLESHGKQLRQLGADVRILSECDSPETAMRISKDEDRILICSVTLLRRIEHSRPNAYLFKPFDKYGKPASISALLHKFNVQLSAKNMLSRCEICNSEEGIKLSTGDINFLQECVKNQDFTTPNSDEAFSDFQRTLNELIKSGVIIKFKDKLNIFDTEKPQAFLCTKCGTVQ